MAIRDYYLGKINIFKGTKTDALKEAKKQYGYKYVITKVKPYMGSTHVYEILGHDRGFKKKL